MAKYAYRDTRTGAFVSEETYNRSRAHGGRAIVKEEIPEDSITSIDDLFEYEDYDGEMDYYEVQGTGDTGHRE
jgi:hypothetical protein